MTICNKITLLALALMLLASTPVFTDQDAETDSSGIETTESIATEEEEQDKKKAKDPDRGRFLPIPIFITEPAIGEGLGIALAYFHRAKDVNEKDTFASPGSIGQASREQKPPPTVTAVFAAYTSNDTKAGGIGHMNTFRDDHIRFSGAVGLADVNSTFYILDHPFKFNLEGLLAFQETNFRFGDSRWFWGIGLSYLDASVAYKVEPPDDVPVDLFRTEFVDSGLAGAITWDTRDNTSMPNRGQLFELALWRHDEAIGGDFDYWNAKLKLLSFHPLYEKFVLGLRLEFSAIDGQAPFFAVPWVSLRGIPALRYQGDQVAVAEIEGRYNFSSRWAMIAFTGTGSVSSDIPIIDTEQSIYSYGVGGRYKVFEAQNVWVGLDIARGPEDTNWYIQVGHAW